MPVDLDALVAELRFVNAKKKDRSLQLLAAITDPPLLTRTIDGSSTLRVVVNDPDRVLIGSDAVRRRSWAVVDGMHFELTQVSKSSDRFTLTFEDAIIAALRRFKDPMSIPRNSTTRHDVALRVARKSEVKVLVDPADKEKIHNAIHFNQGKDRVSAKNGWDLVTTEIAQPINWRCFSDGRRLVIGGDPWLLDRDKDVTVLRERTGPVQDIDFDLSTRKRASTATVTVDAERWSVPPGSAVRVDGLGPADGRWLVSTFERPLTSTRATVSLVRKRHVLDEPKATGAGERGSRNFVPLAAGSSNGGTAATPGRERMVRFILAQVGKDYEWGASGPTAFDCSGLVQGGAAAGGRPLPKPSASQWAKVQAEGQVIPVSEALRTRGALLFRIGDGEFNHVAVSLGNGSVVEALGEAYGVVVSGDAGSRTWTGAGIWL